MYSAPGEYPIPLFNFKSFVQQIHKQKNPLFWIGIASATQRQLYFAAIKINKCFLEGCDAKPHFRRNKVQQRVKLNTAEIKSYSFFVILTAFTSVCGCYQDVHCCQISGCCFAIQNGNKTITITSALLAAAPAAYVRTSASNTTIPHCNIHFNCLYSFYFSVKLLSQRISNERCIFLFTWDRRR